jgi:hypothetical protein
LVAGGTSTGRSRLAMRGDDPGRRTERAGVRYEQATESSCHLTHHGWRALEPWQRRWQGLEGDTPMSSSYASERPNPPTPAPPMAGWIGMVVFAGIMLLILGSLQAIQGLVALYRNDYYLADPADLAIPMSYKAYGWVHLIVGLVIVTAGIGVLLGQVWARIVAIVFAVFSALTNLTFLAALPLWCTILIGLNVIAIYALAVHGGEIRPRH